MRLWEGPAPGVAANPGEEMVEPSGRVSNVSIPTLTAYLPKAEHASGTAIIIFSGGAYIHLASGPLGRAAADAFLQKGIAIFSLRYRLAPPSTNVLRDALADAKCAVRTVRSRAAEWHVNRDCIGIIGFSAGANLALNLACDSDKGDPASTNPVEKQSSRPDFIGLFAPWPFNQRIEDFKIKPAMPPAFIAHARDDSTAPFSFAEEIARAFKQAGVPIRFEPYDQGGHMAFNFRLPLIKEWPAKLLSWLKNHKLYTELL